MAQDGTIVTDAFRLDAQLWTMRNSGIMCDVVLKGCETNAEEIDAHTLVLGARSSYFQALFTPSTQTSPSPREKIEVQLRTVPSATVSLLLEYMYTSRVKIDENNVESLLTAAIFVDLHSLAEHCWSFLERRMIPFNCLMEHRLADLYQRTGFAEKTRKLILRHFTTIPRRSGFLQLDKNMLMKFLVSGDLNVEDEDAVLDAVLRWVRHDPVHRTTMLPDLLSTVRLVHVTSDHLQYSLAEFTGQGDVGMLAQMQEAVDVAYSAPQGPRDSYEFIRVFVGCVGASFACVDPLNGTCARLAPVPNGKDLKVSGVVGVDDSVFVLGDLKGRVVWCLYYPESAIWMPLASPQSAHFHGGVVAVGGHIYALGGCNTLSTANRPLRTVEQYDSTTNRWRKVAELPRPLASFGCVAHQTGIFVFGSAGLSEEAWRYDTLTDAWTALCKMPRRRAGCSACVGDEGMIYILGGLERLKQKQPCLTVDVYNPVANRWSLDPVHVKDRYRWRREEVHWDVPTVSDLDASGVGLAVGAFNGQVYVIGDYRSSAECQDGVQVYDGSMDYWYITPCSVPRLNSANCAFVKIRQEFLRNSLREHRDDEPHHFA